MRYNGPLNESVIRQFIFDSANNIAKDMRRNSGLNDVTTGVPIYGDHNEYSYIKMNTETLALENGEYTIIEPHNTRLLVF